MADVKLIMAVVFAVTGVVLITIAALISGIISRRFTGDLKTRLTANAALTGLTAAFAAATGVFGILYARAKSSDSKSSRALLIAFLVIAVITLVMYATIIGLSLSARNASGLNQNDKNALAVGLILIAGGIVCLLTSALFFFTITKGKSGKEALESIRFQRRPRDKSTVAGQKSMTAGSP